MKSFGKVLSAVTLIICFSLNTTKADVITDWNQTAIRLLLDAKLPAGAPPRVLAMMHAAMFDAANATGPRYASYGSGENLSQGSSAAAAASAAARQILVAVIPAQKANLDLVHESLMGTLPQSPDKKTGVALGERVAATLLAQRANDGSDFSTNYEPVSGAGMYVKTSSAQMASPSLPKMKPFILSKSDSFRPLPPPSVDSAQAKRDIEEVKSLGQKASSARTSDQTAIAIFHVPPGFLVWNTIGRAAIEARALDVIDSARAMALLNFALIDSQLAIWDAKYAYNYWRPRTAINASTQQVATSTAVAAWEPLLAEPMHPEYPCAHCGIGAGAANVLEGLFGSGPFHFAARTGQLGNISRAYTSFRQFEEEEAISRIYGGVHFRWSNIVGEAVGKQVAKKVLDSLPRK